MQTNPIFTITQYGYYRSIEKPIRTNLLNLLAENYKDFVLASGNPQETNETPPPMEKRLELVEKYLRSGFGLLVVTDQCFNVAGVSLFSLDALIEGHEEKVSNLLINFTLVDPKYRLRGIGRTLYDYYQDLNEQEYKKPFIIRGVWGKNPVQEHLLDYFGFALAETSTKHNLTRRLYIKEATYECLAHSQEYRHMKTGNIYDYLGTVTAEDEIPHNYTTMLVAKCSENPAVRIRIYFASGRWVYKTDDNPELYENKEIKVLYTRDNNLWLRTKSDFHKVINLDGLITPRFVFVPQDSPSKG